MAAPGSEGRHCFHSPTAMPPQHTACLGTLDIYQQGGFASQAGFSALTIPSSPFLGRFYLEIWKPSFSHRSKFLQPLLRRSLRFPLKTEPTQIIVLRTILSCSSTQCLQWKFQTCNTQNVAEINSIWIFQYLIWEIGLWWALTVSPAGISCKWPNWSSRWGFISNTWIAGKVFQIQL